MILAATWAHSAPERTLSSGAGAGDTRPSGATRRPGQRGAGLLRRGPARPRPVIAWRPRSLTSSLVWAGPLERTRLTVEEAWLLHLLLKRGPQPGCSAGCASSATPRLAHSLPGHTSLAGSLGVCAYIGRRGVLQDRTTRMPAAWPPGRRRLLGDLCTGHERQAPRRRWRWLHLPPREDEAGVVGCPRGGPAAGRHGLTMRRARRLAWLATV